MYYVYVFITELNVKLFLSQNPIANQTILLPREFAGTVILMIPKTSLVLNLSPRLGNRSILHSAKNDIPSSFPVVCWFCTNFFNKNMHKLLNYIMPFELRVQPNIGCLNYLPINDIIRWIWTLENIHFSKVISKLTVLHALISTRGRK